MSDTLREAYGHAWVMTKGVMRFRLAGLLAWAVRHRVGIAWWGIGVTLIFGGYDAGLAFGKYVVPMLLLLVGWRIGQKVTDWSRTRTNRLTRR